MVFVHMPSRHCIHLHLHLVLPPAGFQVANLAGEVLDKGLDAAQGGIHILRVPWLLVEGQETLKINRDGEPTPDSNK
jgi:hypothetical protein